MFSSRSSEPELRSVCRHSESTHPLSLPVARPLPLHHIPKLDPPVFCVISSAEISCYVFSSDVVLPTGGGSGGSAGAAWPPTLAKFNISPMALHGKKYEMKIAFDPHPKIPPAAPGYTYLFFVNVQNKGAGIRLKAYI